MKIYLAGLNGRRWTIEEYMKLFLADTGLKKWIVDTLPNCYKATVIESENNEATYEI